MRIILAQPRGFCAGVERAIGIVERALRLYGPPVYVRHEIVHNRRVVEFLQARGARFVDEVTQVPKDGIIVFSAHGVSRSVEENARRRGLRVIDATCPLVTKVHQQGERYADNDYDVVLIGHQGHPEVEGTMGRISGPVHLISTIEDLVNVHPRDANRVAYVTQTTLSVDDTRNIIEALTKRFPRIVGPELKDICYATRNRQVAVRGLATVVDLLVVVGAHNSSNSNRLREIGDESGLPSYLIQDASFFQLDWLEGVETMGITAGASAPEVLVVELLTRLAEVRDIEIEFLGDVEENVRFRFPEELADVAMDAQTLEHSHHRTVGLRPA